MMQELAKELSFKGHDVTVATAWPQSNLSLEGKAGLRPVSLENGVRVIRVKIPLLYNKNYIIRGITQLLMPRIIWSSIRKYLPKKINSVIVYSPPLPLTLIGSRIKKTYGAWFLLNIQDIFPQNAIDLGIMRNPLLIRFFESLEKKSYVYADQMTSHSESSRKFLIETKGVPEGKIHTVPNWIDLGSFKKVQRSNSFRKEYGLEDKFVFLFAGIIGPSQGLNLIIDIAKELKGISDICFLLVGEGTEKEKLKTMAESYGLNNVLFKPLVPAEKFPELVKDADVGLVCLSSMNKTPVVPGKLLGYMAAGIPIVAFLNKESDGHALIRKAKCGYSMNSDSSSERSKEMIIRIYNERGHLHEYGKAGLDYVSRYFSREACLNKLISLIHSY